MTEEFHSQQTIPTDAWRRAVRHAVAGLLWAHAAPRASQFDPEFARAALNCVAEPEHLSAWLSIVAADPPSKRRDSGGFRLDELIPSEVRKSTGAYYTPDDLAERMTEQAERPERAVDLACGDGALLAAVHRRWPEAELIGIELDFDLAMAAAARAVIEGWNGRVIWGDGLVDRALGADLVILNPPYLGEKGHKELFRELRDRHAHLAHVFAARMDLANLFLVQGMQTLRSGGRLIALTSEYWLQADSAEPVRDAVRARNVVRFERLGSRNFDSAPGHHSLITVVEQGEPSAYEVVDGENQRVGQQHELEDPRWNPFVEPVQRDGVPLGEVVTTSQGFVSGADRLTKRHINRFGIEGEVGDAIFLFDERPGWADSAEPVLRGSQLTPGEVIREFEPLSWVIWLDGRSEAGTAELQHLEPYRPILEQRREARSGAMPWYRLHWPRDREQMARPKLVAPRRTSDPGFALDLTGAVVSSDCTFIVAPHEAHDEVEFLTNLMRELNSPDVRRWLRRNGKMKGDLFEMYAGPLEAVPVDPGRLFSTG